MVKRKVIVYAASAGFVALLMSSCGGSDSPPAPQAVKACSAGSACVTTVAGTGEPGTTDGMAEAAQFWMPHSVAVDAESNIHVADYGNN
ncbi:MAG TPA: hypothetical protein VLI06_20585, partial [Solimonas sp.]|nr:hypothetical protein [Solimonas sp.]